MIRRKRTGVAVIGGSMAVANGMCIPFAGHEHLSLIALGPAVADAGIAFTAQLMAEDRRITYASRPPPPDAIRPASLQVGSGVLVPRARLSIIPYAIYALVGALALLCVAEFNPALGVPGYVACGLGAVALGTLPLLVAFRRPVPGGLTLTRTGIEHRSWGTVTRLSWMEVGDIAFSGDGRHVRIRAQAGLVEREFTAPVWRGKKSPEDVMDIPTRYLGMNAWEVAAMLTHLRDTPASRGELDDVDAVRRRFATQPPAPDL